VKKLSLYFTDISLYFTGKNVIKSDLHTSTSTFNIIVKRVIRAPMTCLSCIFPEPKARVYWLYARYWYYVAIFYNFHCCTFEYYEWV